MIRTSLLSHIWLWHCLCCLLAVLSSIPILWPQVFLPDAWEARIISYSGWVMLLSFATSLLLLAVSSFLLMLRLHNLRTLGQLLLWATLWLASGFVFSLFAYLADVPTPWIAQADTEDSQRADILHLPEDHLIGPDSLQVSIVLEPYQTDTLVHALNLSLLDMKHNDLLRAYVDASPRWASYTRDDTFYTKPGHVVMTPPSTEGIQGLVHVAFRRLVEGEPLPTGYTIVRPGDPMPPTPEGSEQVPDLAVDLGGSHYLLLAWRGTSHAETAHRALNAALSTVDDMVARLADSPTEATLQRILVGKRDTPGNTPTILLSQPATQYGAYQAEVYANPGEPGTLMLRIVNLEDGATLRLFSCPAQFSANAEELFRHDYPGLMRAYSVGHVPGLMPEKAPLFIVRPGESHQFFGVACEIVFDPSAPNKPGRTLLRRCYRVQAYEDPNAPDEPENPPPPAGEQPAAEPPAEPAPAPQDTPPPPAPEPPAPAPAPAEPQQPLPPGLPLENPLPTLPDYAADSLYPPSLNPLHTAPESA